MLLYINELNILVWDENNICIIQIYHHQQVFQRVCWLCSFLIIPFCRCLYCAIFNSIYVWIHASVCARFINVFLGLALKFFNQTRLSFFSNTISWISQYTLQVSRTIQCIWPGEHQDTSLIHIVYSLVSGFCSFLACPLCHHNTNCNVCHTSSISHYNLT